MKVIPINNLLVEQHKISFKIDLKIIEAYCKSLLKPLYVFVKIVIQKTRFNDIYNILKYKYLNLDYMKVCCDNLVDRFYVFASAFFGESTPVKKLRTVHIKREEDFSIRKNRRKYWSLNKTYNTNRNKFFLKRIFPGKGAIF